MLAYGEKAKQWLVKMQKNWKVEAASGSRTGQWLRGCEPPLHPSPGLP